MTSTFPRHADIDSSPPGGLHKSGLAEVPRASSGAAGSIGCLVARTGSGPVDFLASRTDSSPVDLLAADPSAETGVA